MIIEGARKLTIDYTKLTDVTMYTKTVSGTTLYPLLFNADTFNSASTNDARKSAVASLQLTNAFLKIQAAIKVHIVNFPKQATETDVSVFYTTKEDANKANAAYQLTFNHGASNSDLYKYDLSVEEITRNSLVQQQILDVVNLADGMCKTDANKIALTFTETQSIGKTQAEFDALTADAKTLIAGPLAVARFKSKKSNASPNRFYSDADVLAYSMPLAQLTHLKWGANEKHYVLYLASSIGVPVVQSQIDAIKADYAKQAADSTKRLTTTIDFTKEYSKETAIGQYAILQFK